MYEIPTKLKTILDGVVEVGLGWSVMERLKKMAIGKLRPTIWRDSRVLLAA
jgi:hypothetical protein